MNNLLLAVAFCIGAVPLGVHQVGLTWNASQSMPEGIYQVAPMAYPVARGKIVTVCPDTQAAALGLARGYLDPGSACADGVAALLKPVAAVPGDTVTVSARGVSVNGRLIPNSAALSADDMGRTLQSVPAGVYAVPQGAVWVISSHDPRSFDSRYYGPVPVQNIKGIAHAIFVGK